MQYYNGAHFNQGASIKWEIKVEMRADGRHDLND